LKKTLLTLKKTNINLEIKLISVEPP